MKPPVENNIPVGAVGAAASSYTSTSGSDWEPAGDGLWTKSVYADPARRERTLLFRMDPGAHSSVHCHEDFEQVYVLEGSFYDDDRLVRAGEFCARAPGAMHSATSEEGALMLVVYTGA